MSGRGPSSRDNNDAGRITLKGFFSGGGGSGSGSGKPSHDDKKSTKLSKSAKREAETLQQQYHDLVIAELRNELPALEKQLGSFPPLRHDFDGTKGLLQWIFRSCEIKGGPNSDQGKSQIGHDTDTLVDAADGGRPHTYRRDVDDFRYEDLQKLKEDNRKLLDENARLSKENYEAVRRTTEFEENIKQAIFEERRVAQNQRVGLKTQLENEIRTEFQRRIENLQNSLAVERRNVVKEKSDKAKESQEYRASQEKLEQQYQREINDLTIKHDKDLLWMQQECQRRVRDGTQDLQAQIRGMEDDHTTALADAERNFDLEREKWDQAKTKLLQKYNDDMEEQRESLSQELHRETEKHLEEQRSLNDTLDEVKAKHKEKINRLRDEASVERQKLEAQVQEQKDALEKERAELLEESAKLETRLKREAEEAEVALKKKYEQMFAEIGEKHEKDKEQLRQDRDAYSAALLERDKVRDKVEFLSDVQVTTKFHKLVKEVEELARIEWRSDANLESTLKTLSVQPKTLMRQLLQDSIWVVLHEYIFCSPFRIFGEEGKRLEAEWAQKCGEDPAFNNGCYTWPTPEVDTERWRFATVKECRASLRKPLPSVYDPRAQLKIGYGTGRKALQDKLSDVLNEVADVETKHSEAIDKLTKQAAPMWLEFSMQHYRIIMVVGNAKVDSIHARLRLARTSSLELVTVPRLKSYGNSKGRDLKAEETIKTCEGETHTIGAARSSRGAMSRRPSISQRN